MDNGRWLRGNWTNYTECADSYDEYIRTSVRGLNEVGKRFKIIFFKGFYSFTDRRAGIGGDSAAHPFHRFNCFPCVFGISIIDFLLL